MSDLLKPGAIKLHVEATDKDELLEELVDLLVQTGDVKDREGVLAALRKREEMGSTGIGRGVAVPHAKHESIEKLVAALGISRRGVEFESLDGRPARAIFLLLARVDNPGPHVRALAEIARLVETPHFMDKLLGAKTPAEVLHIIRSEE